MVAASLIVLIGFVVVAYLNATPITTLSPPINPFTCRNASLVQLLNGTCVLITDAQIATVNTLRGNQTNVIAIASALSDYLSAASVANVSAVDTTLTVLEVDTLVQRINETVTIGTIVSFIMSQPMNDSDVVLGASFVSQVGGRIVTNASQTSTTNSNISTAAIVAFESLTSVSGLSVLIIDVPSDYCRLNITDNKTIASSVVVASVQRNDSSSSSSANMNISLYFQIREQYRPNVAADYYCSFYNTSINRWSDSGCTDVIFNASFNRYECSCNHSNSFALTWSPKKLNAAQTFHYEGTSSLIFQLISIICFLGILVHWIVLRLVNPMLGLRATDLLPLISCASTILFFVFFIALGFTVFTRSEDSQQMTCFTSAGVLMFFVYFFLILMFCVKASVGYFNYLRFVYLFPPPMPRFLGILLIISFAISITMVAFAAGLNSHSSLNITQLYPYKICWFTRQALVYFLTIPISIFLFLNIFMIVVVAWKLIDYSRRAPSTDLTKERMKKVVLLLLASCITQGLGWLFGPFLTNLDPTAGNVLAWAFDFFNGLEGLWSVLLYAIIRQQRVDENKLDTIGQRFVA